MALQIIRGGTSVPFSDFRAANRWSVHKVCAVLVLTWLSAFSSAAAADALPAPTWHVGGTPIASSAVEACGILAPSYKLWTGQPATAYTVSDITSPIEKICQVWEGQGQIGNPLLQAACFFNGTISGSKNGHEYWPWSSINVAFVGGALACVCPTTQPEYDSKFGVCHGASYALNLLGNTETRPAGIGGISSVQVTAKVAAGGRPKPRGSC